MVLVVNNSSIADLDGLKALFTENGIPLTGVTLQVGEVGEATRFRASVVRGEESSICFSDSCPHSLARSVRLELDKQAH